MKAKASLFPRGLWRLETDKAMTQERNRRDARIVRRAAEIWSEEGRPMNRHEEQWLMAMREIDDEDRSGDAATWESAMARLAGAEIDVYREALGQSASALSNDDITSAAVVISRIRAITNAAKRIFLRR
ncbi:DUF2934 domain-containing protein [Mesorhizobium sp. UC22_110]|uniref:DUF2934 domain-containing protein n=2 Tax=unclassified Mesorhizobium TaxID=325217 RepID=UPI00375729A9